MIGRANPQFSVPDGKPWIEVHRVSAQDQRYESLDDWIQEGDRLQFKIVSSGNPTYDKLILIHSIIEQVLAEAEGITGEEIDEFDLNYKGDEEPGEQADAPYRDAHIVAKGIEMILCGYLSIPWTHYNARVLAPIEKDADQLAIRLLRAP